MNNNKPIIICWGDSITQGAYINDDTKEYPGVLQALLGDNYDVRCGGYGGDSSWSIMARQGAIPLTTKRDILFPDGVATVTIGHRIEGTGLLRDDGEELTKINVQMAVHSISPMDLRINPVYINDMPYHFDISFAGLGEPKDGVYYITVTRPDTNGALTIPAGATVKFSNTDITKQSYCDVFLMGANDAIPNDPIQVQALIDRYKKAIAYHGNNQYIVIIPFWSDFFDEAFLEAFGKHAIPLRTLACEKGLETENLTPSELDKQMIAEGKFPASLRWNHHPNEPHLTVEGYHFLARCVYEKGVELGYWK